MGNRVERDSEHALRSYNYWEFHAAVKADEEQKALALLEKEPTMFLDDVLRMASALGNQTLVREFCKRGANIHYRNSGGFTPLHSASWNGRLEVVKFLLSINANPNVTDNTGRTCLHLVCNDRDAEILIVHQLVVANADIDSVDRDGTRCITSAFINGHADIVRYLVEAGADVNPYVEGKQSVVSLSIDQDDIEMLELLVEYGANLDLLHPGGEALSKICESKSDLQEAVQRADRKYWTRLELLTKCLEVELRSSPTDLIQIIVSYLYKNFKTNRRKIVSNS